MHPANDRRRYVWKPSFIRWAHTQNDPWRHESLTPICSGNVVVIPKRRAIEFIFHVSTNSNYFYDLYPFHQKHIQCVDKPSNYFHTAPSQDSASALKGTCVERQLWKYGKKLQCGFWSDMINFSIPRNAWHLNPTYHLPMRSKNILNYITFEPRP